MRRPSIQQLSPALARAAREVAEVLGRAGRRAWLVGGAVRDLALGVEPVDADLTTAARPEEIEALFPDTYAVGRAFGTVVVHRGEVDVQVTTFRIESGYADARRPSEVSFAATLEEDAQRRDFTCNALYLDPLVDELLDPTGGLPDLAAGRLRCVGEPRRRFAEDGLRLLRLARLAAQYGLEVEEATGEGARASLDALRGVSPERVLGELQRMATGRAPGRAARLLFNLGVLPRLPGTAWLAGEAQEGDLEGRVAGLERLGSRGTAAFLATLFRARTGEAPVAHRADLEALRPSRALQQEVAALLDRERELSSCLAALELGEPPRAIWIRLVRDPAFELALACWIAWHPGEREAECLRLRSLAREATVEELWPAPLVTSAELGRAGIPRGPRWGELLSAGEEAQLNGEFADLDGARKWLAARALG